MSILQIVLFFAAAPFAFAVLAWISFRQRRPIAVEAFDFTELPGRTPDRTPDRTNVRPAAEMLDLPVVLRAVADSLEPLARERATRISLAVSPGRTVHANERVLTTALRDTMETALHASTGGQILVSVLPLGTQLHILVTDHNPNSRLARRESMARDASSLLALQGGTLAVEVRPGHGTTVTLRLPLLTGGAPVAGGMEGPVQIEERVAVS